ncbi:MAG TPA: glycosyltransferase family 2 protein [Bacteroidales bacterium]|nr:glycosyltransferase family 2 protein [Bacteroidales bacterium]
MNISVLIPVFDYDIVAFVHSLKSALGKVPEFCEILIGDDGSSSEYRKKYLSLEGDGVKVIISEKNIGRAAIRNKLALEAKGDFFLFIDADAMFPGTAEAYMLKWLPKIDASMVFCGGILYKDSPPGDPDKLLRWKYGKMKEQRKAVERNKHPHAGFTTFNVLINKSVFAKIRFNEDLKQYGHEDTLLAYQLKKARIDILHIDNGLVHEGLESNKEFLSKTKLGIENLSKLYDNVTDKKSFSEAVRILRFYNKLRFFRLTRILAKIFIIYRDRMEIRLDSSNISLKLFGFYKICMFCTYREIHRRKNILPGF